MHGRNLILIFQGLPKEELRTKVPGSKNRGNIDRKEKDHRRFDDEQGEEVLLLPSEQIQQTMRCCGVVTIMWKKFWRFGLKNKENIELQQERYFLSQKRNPSFLAVEVAICLCQSRLLSGVTHTILKNFSFSGKKSLTTNGMGILGCFYWKMNK